jgi:hypothetical protein
VPEIRAVRTLGVQESLSLWGCIRKDRGKEAKAAETDTEKEQRKQ